MRACRKAAGCIYARILFGRLARMTYQGTFRKGVVVLDSGATLPEGTPVTVTTVGPQPAQNTTPARGPKAGSAKGKVWMSPDFDEPLDDFAEYTK